MGVVGVGSAEGVTRKRISKLTSVPHSCFVNHWTAIAIINFNFAAGEEKK